MNKDEWTALFFDHTSEMTEMDSREAADLVLQQLAKEEQAKQRIVRPSKEAVSLRNLFSRLVLRKADFSATGSYDTESREIVDTVERANVATSQITGSLNHQLVIDIDHPAWLVKSSTPGHFHLYVEVPGGIDTYSYFDLLDSLAAAGVVEEGYARASRRRGYSAVRLPWVKKETPPPAASPVDDDPADRLDQLRKVWGTGRTNHVTITGRQAGKTAVAEEAVALMEFRNEMARRLREEAWRWRR